MIALFNFNSYLGGGETIFTRWAYYLSQEGIPCRLFYLRKSFIADELRRLNVNEDILCPYEGDIDYYYLNHNERKVFVDWICKKLEGLRDVKLVSFCMRELYTLIDVAKQNQNYTLTHLILHDEDNLYVCQSLSDKLSQKLLKKRMFSNKKHLEFNNSLFRSLVSAGGLIAEKMTTKIVMANYGIHFEDDIIVPPPMCEFSEDLPIVQNNKKIIWIGRVVDFKLPAICAMLDFVGTHRDYILTIIGDGDIEYLKKYMVEHDFDGANVYFKGGMPYNEIANVIKQHSIGYACGTSIVEIGQYGLPVITALAAPSHKLFKRAICGGLYNNKYKGNEGNNLFIGETEEEQPLIEKTMEEIKGDFHNAALRSYQAMKSDFNFSTNIKKYMDIINTAKRIDFDSIIIPHSSFLRRYLYKRFSK